MQQPEITDAELVARSIDHPHVFMRLMERYEQRLIRYIMRISAASVDDAQDVLQDVFIKVYQNLHAFDQRLSFSAWIYRITRNQVISQYRKQRRHDERRIDLSDEDIERIADELVLPAEIDNDFRRQTIEQVLTHIDDKYREVLVLRYLEERSYDEIADILKKPPGTVATLLNRAKQRFATAAAKLDITIDAV